MVNDTIDPGDGQTINYLGVLDYVILGFVVFVSAATGIYHGFAKGGQTTTEQFLVADRSMFSIPIAMTLLASFISPITILGKPAEIYTYGGQYFIFILCHLLLFPSIAFIFIPVFHGLKITSAYEYLKLRFGVPLQMAGAFIFMLQTAFYMAIVLYSPALAIEVVTSFDLWKTMLIGGIVCTFYTSLGGMKAVIWTDVIMFVVIFGTTLMVIITGVMKAGGVAHVWETNKEDDRLDLIQFPWDPTQRMTFLNLVIGGFMNSLPMWAVSQTAVQRFLSAKSIRDAQMSIWMNLPFVTLLLIFINFEGLVLYTFYNEPPNVPPNVTKSDQIMIYFVSEQFGHVPGYQGLFIACLWAGTLSTISSGLNAMIAVTLEDMVKPYRRWRAKRNNVPVEENDASDTFRSKILTCIYGVISIFLAFLATKMGTLVSMGNSIFGAAGGPLLAAFTQGMMWKRANSMGTLIGVSVGFVIGLWMTFGGMFYDATDPDTFYLYRVSFMWYATITWSISTLISIIGSEVYRHINPSEIEKPIDPALLVTFLRYFINSFFIRTATA
ncbi:sodium-coupled monocarboxylate transporter 1-like [Anneissia japonica]|uniref:sodium-coupled monocarboxylate transporter 1-like n=1 Tax=Anneissia japonica TaxID=1529436 RepID=UPI0014256F4D|nr:sodium-coupled monocarboxylate transporter 1-like [Anneissia japonica]